MPDLIPVPGVWNFKDGITVQKNFYAPSESVNDDHVSTNANKRIQATKVVHQFPVVRQLFDAATAVSAKTETLFSVYGAAATLVALFLWVEVLADDASRVITVDVKKSTGGGAYASILSSTLDIETTDPVRVPVEVTISDGSLVAEDIVQVVVTIAGSGGTTHAKGLTVQAIVREDPA